MTAPPNATPNATPCAPWWRHGHVWLLLAGPLAVVVAGVCTAWIAARGSDPLVATDYYRRGIEINRSLAAPGTAEPAHGADSADSVGRARLPALQGRNHAVTPARDLR